MNDPAADRGGVHFYSGRSSAAVFCRLDISKQGENEDDDQECPESSDRIVAPTRAVRPRGHGADDQNDQNDKDDEPHFGLCLVDRGRAGASTTPKFPKRSRCYGHLSISK
jgi:hypothetical protein